MGGRSREVKIYITGDSVGGEKALDRIAKAGERTEKSLADTGDRIASAGDQMSTKVTLPILALGTVAFDAASDVEESLSKVEQVFQGSAGSIDAWSQTAAEAMGISRQEALEAAGTFGNLFSAMKIGIPAATDMSKGVIQLAADLASFNNANPEDVLLALRSGLVGEAEPLRQFGINLSAARIEAHALEMGLAKTKDELDAGAKAQAAYDLILQDTTLAQGDFARTADGSANQLKTLKAEAKNAAAEFGDNLLPIGGQLIGFARDATGAFGDLAPEVQTAAVNVGLAAAAAGPLLSVGGRLIKVVGSMADGAEKSAAGLKGMRAAMAAARTEGGGLGSVLASKVRPGVLGVSLALAASAAVIGMWIKSKQDAKAATDEYAAAIEADSGALAENTREQVANKLESTGALEAARKLGIASEDVTDAVMGEGNARERLTQQLGDAYAAQLNAVDGSNELKGSIATLQLAILDESEALDGSADAAYRKAEAVGAAGAATADAVPHISAAAEAEERLARETELPELALEAFKTAMDEIFGANLDVEKATIAYRNEVKALRKELGDNGTTLDLHTQKGRDNRDAILGMVDAARAQSEAMLEEGASTEEATTKFNDHIRELKRVMEQSGFTEEQIDRYTRKLGLVPKKIRTKVEAEVWDAMTQVEQYKALLDTVPKSVRTQVLAHVVEGRPGTEGAPASSYRKAARQEERRKQRRKQRRRRRRRKDRDGQRAVGGDVQFGQRYLVGEDGPEEFVPGVSGVIVPNHRLGEGGGGGMSKSDMRDALAEALAQLPRGDLTIVMQGPPDRPAEESAAAAMRTARHLGGW